ncbi:hypothetical protein HPP92_028728 [Vanilla planifolia]|uniref:Uncharacterized protein n=1 Tax=Vanilla planifolia TaxID=51239 RepID=A0A835P720_VANPL|nr:hypothetical protein HPP92_028728 [Vanilla planifolia]
MAPLKLYGRVSSTNTTQVTGLQTRHRYEFVAISSAPVLKNRVHVSITFHTPSTDLVSAISCFPHFQPLALTLTQIRHRPESAAVELWLEGRVAGVQPGISSLVFESRQSCLLGAIAEQRVVATEAKQRGA